MDAPWNYLMANQISEMRDLEYKEGLPWKGLKLQITKAASAMANLAAGGYIIIGVKEAASANKFFPAGLSKDDSATCKKDAVAKFLNAHADPHIDADVREFSDGERHFVAIQICEFADVPVTFKKGASGIRAGQMCVRPRRVAESVAVPSAAEFGEVMDDATDKGILRQLGRFKSYNRAREDAFGEGRES